MIRSIQKYLQYVSHLGKEEPLDEIQSLNNILVNQIHMIVMGCICLFFIKDAYEGNPDVYVTGPIILLMLLLLMFRSKLSYISMVTIQLIFFCLGISVISYIHSGELRPEGLYIICASLGFLFFYSKWAKFFYLSFIYLNYISIEWMHKNLEPSTMGTLAEEDNSLLFLFGLIVISVILYRYSSLLYTLINSKSELVYSLRDKNMELERFAYITSHDLKEPVRNIGSFAGLLKKQINKPNSQKLNTDYIEIIQESSKHLNSLIEEILKYSKLTHSDLDKELVDLNDIIENLKISFDSLIKDKNVKIYQGQLPSIMGSRLYFSLLFQNLIENSIKYNDKSEPYIHIDSMDKGPYVLITLRDNGIGIEEQYLSSIFEPFTRLHSRTKYEGTGLGLSICKRIVESHQGSIRIESEPKKGSSFHIQLPKTQDASAAI